MKNNMGVSKYIGSQQHWEDNINDDYDKREQSEQIDNRVQPDLRKDPNLDSINNRMFRCNRCSGKYELLVGKLESCCTAPVKHNLSGVCGGELIEFL